MKRYFVDDNGRRRKVTKSNIHKYMDAKYWQWIRIRDELHNRSGEHEIDYLQNQLDLGEAALEDDSDRWNNHRDEVYADYIAAGWTKDEIDKDWEEHLAELPKRITNLKNDITTMEIDMNLACRPERTVKGFIDRFGTSEKFIDNLEAKVMKELNM